MQNLYSENGGVPYVSVSVAGGYWTGSSAVVDLLNEHKHCVEVKEEFTLFSFGQFFKEVHTPLLDDTIDSRQFASNLKRFKSFNKSDFYPFRSIIRTACRKAGIYPKAAFWRQAGMAKLLGQDYQNACNDLLTALNAHSNARGSISETEFSNHIERIVNLSIEASIDGMDGEKSSAFVGAFDQIVAPPYAKYAARAIPSMRFINVDRNWKDQYISLRGIYKAMLNVNSAIGIKPWNEDFEPLLNAGPIDYFVEIRRMIDQEKHNQKDAPNTMWTTFEELINSRDETTKKVFEFLGLSTEGWAPDTHFHPDRSRKNTEKWKNPARVTPEILDEIAQLELRLNY